MAYLGNGVEYGLHCLLWLVEMPDKPVSSRELADLQGISPSFLAKIFPKFEKAGIVTASEGIQGGYLLSRDPVDITVLDVVEAIDGKKPLFDCQEIRGKCAVFGERPPDWSLHGVCAVHSVMLRAEQSMRDELARTTLADLAKTVNRRAPKNFPTEIHSWLSIRGEARTEARLARIAQSRIAAPLQS